jgi:cellulose synthase/poly-beta-1,6-N-acetylglucosamine synthase-like glycosyltransferase
MRNRCVWEVRRDVWRGHNIRIRGTAGESSGQDSSAAPNSGPTLGISAVSRFSDSPRHVLCHPGEAPKSPGPERHVIAALFWVSVGLLGWTYLGYPAVMIARGRLRRSLGAPHDLPAPRVTVVLAVRNGASHIGNRIRNLLDQPYPGELDVVVVLNGCTDETPIIAREIASNQAGVLVLESPAAEGKAGALNRGVAAATGDVVIFADVRQRFARGAVKRLVKTLMQPGVGMVSGRLVITDGGAAAVRGTSHYWFLETALRQAESRTGSVIGVSGAICAVRRELYREIPPGTILDDVYLPLRVALEGYRVALEPRAVAVDQPSGSQRDEYRRRVRTLLGNVQLVQLMPELLSPRRNRLFARFVSHKLLRVLSPLLFLAMLITGMLLPGLVYQAVVLALLALLAAGVIGLLVPIPMLSLPAAFLLVQVAALEALFRRRRAVADVWTP